MYFMYDKDTFEYKGSVVDFPGEGVTNFTKVEPSDAEVPKTWFLRIYQPETDTWRDWAPEEYQKWVLDAKKPDSSEAFNIALLNEIASLKLEQAYLREELENNVSTH